jgi:hypothetical protein
MRLLQKLNIEAASRYQRTMVGFKRNLEDVTGRNVARKQNMSLVASLYENKAMFWRFTSQ